jgi:hypothetical protein
MMRMDHRMTVAQDWQRRGVQRLSWNIAHARMLERFFSQQGVGVGR